MKSLGTPPRRRNGQIRACYRLLTHQVKCKRIPQSKAVRELCRQLGLANGRIRNNPHDKLEGFDVGALFDQAKGLLEGAFDS